MLLEDIELFHGRCIVLMISERHELKWHQLWSTFIILICTIVLVNWVMYYSIQPWSTCCIFGRHELSRKLRVVLIGNKKRTRLFCCFATRYYIEQLARAGEENMVWGSDLECINKFASGDVGAQLMQDLCEEKLLSHRFPNIRQGSDFLSSGEDRAQWGLFPEMSMRCTANVPELLKRKKK